VPIWAPMSILAQRAREERGFTLVEVLAATVVLLIGIFATFTLMERANQASFENRNREAANNVGRQIAETAKKIPYTAVTASGVVSSLQAQPGMADVDPLTPGWQFDARNQRFKIDVTECAVDDQQDGYGTVAAHAAAGVTWCSSSLPTGTDTNAEDFKRVTVTVTPPGTAAKTTTVTSIIADTRANGTSGGSGGSGGGSGVGSGSAILQDPPCGGCSPAAWTYSGNIAPCKTFSATVGTDKCNPTYNGAPGANFTSGNTITSIPVKAIFPSSVSSVKFYTYNLGSAYVAGNGLTWWPPPATFLADGTLDSTSGGRVWTTTWSLQNTYPNQTPDGPYLVKAFAYDASNNQVGVPLTLSLWLNRFIPDNKALQVPIVGRNTQYNKTEVEFYPTAAGTTRRDYDYGKYQVYRGATLACSVDPYQANVRDWTSPTPNWGFQVSNLTGSGFQGTNPNCQDQSAPSSGVVTYTVKIASFAPDGWAETEGGNNQSASVDANAANTKPTAPSNFNVQWTTVGGVRGYLLFTWTQPSTPTTSGDTAGDCIMGYRIYLSLNSSTFPVIGDRSWRTPWGNTGSAPCKSTSQAGSWTSPKTSTSFPATKSKFYITSVDSHLTESNNASTAFPAAQTKVLSPLVAP
jgi:Tfp pilus assembly protein PilV